ncbi:MAG: ABC transporter permease subunit [Phycisphaerae bacterium]|nr:ABC transporter permease subunit [Phycisphaerae bacterium]
MTKLVTIAKNTLTETLRQPIYAILIGCAILLYILSPSLTMYTLDDDNKLLREICLSTLFLASLFVAIFSAAGAVAEELDNKTISTVLSKPVSRPVYVLAKFLGVSCAVAIAHFICTAAMLLAIRHGVMETANDTHDWTVITAGLVTVGGALVMATFFNYVFGWKFSSSVVVLMALFSAISLLFLCFVDRHWQFNPGENHFNRFDIYAAILLLLAAIVITALAIALSSRFNIIITLAACVGIFLLGLVSDYVLGNAAEAHLWARIARYVVPNLQVFWISDAIYEGNPVPARYIGTAATYAACYTGAVLAIAVGLFQRRQVG